MSDAYFNSIDYDAVRINDVVELYQFPIVRKRESKKVSLPILIATAVVLALVWYALRFIPIFDVGQINFQLNGSYTSLPYQVTQQANRFLGRSLMSSTPIKLKNSLEQLPTVKKAVVKRKLFSTLLVELEMAEPHLIVSSVDSNNEEVFYFVDKKSLVKLDIQDLSMYQKSAFTIGVESTYLDKLLANGIDENLEDIFYLTNQVTLNQGSFSTTLGKVDYQKAIDGSFGKLAIKLPQYHSTLHINEAVLHSQLKSAVGLIKLEQKANNNVDNIVLGKQLHYDLYQSGLVKRQ